MPFWRDARAHTNHGLAELRTQLRADIAQVRAESQHYREESRAEDQRHHEDSRAESERHREETRVALNEIKSEVVGLRTDVQSLSERQSRTEGILQALLAGRTDPNHQSDAA